MICCRIPIARTDQHIACHAEWSGVGDRILRVVLRIADCHHRLNDGG
jgi:hypothetical protein